MVFYKDKILKKTYKEIKKILMPKGIDEDDLDLEDGYLIWALKDQLNFGKNHD